MLGGTGLTYRRAASGAWLIVPGPPAPPQELAVPEILIVGKRTQNFDIRRRRDDIQPYDVSTGASITRAHVDNVDNYFRSRVTANTEFASPTLLTTGATNSEIDLRGLGPDATLVLIDGRRMPGLPFSALALGQPDLNAIPIHSIDRIETLTGTAGGIFGFGALGGVVNVILKRAYRGAELNLTGGISSRGDARRLTLEGRVGFTPDHGRTNVMLYVSREWSQPLRIGERSFSARNRRDTARLADFLIGFAFPNANSIGVNGLGTNLTFKPEFGGATLPSDHSFLPTGSSGSPSDLVAALTQHAGETDVTFTSGEGHTLIHSNPKVTAGVVNVRHHFSDSIEAYFDGLLLRNHGQYLDHAGPTGGVLVLGPSSDINPFDQFVLVQFPMPATRDKRINVDSERYTAGLIAKLPRKWRGTAEATFGATHYDQSDVELITAVPSWDGLNPLGNWTDFQEALSAFQSLATQTSRPTNHYQEQLLQLAGPLFTTAAGPATLAVSLERHREKVDAFATKADNFTGSSSIVTPAHSSTTRSAHAELNAHVFGESSPVFFFRGLDVQLAARFDSQKVAFSTDPARPSESLFRTDFTGVAYTAGAKVQPLPWLMLRGSFATGHQPPPLAALITLTFDSTFTIARDPKRGDAFLFQEGIFPFLFGGNRNLSKVRANTLTLGAIFSPLRDKTLRLSLDYSRIHKTDDVAFFFDQQVILDHESDFPGRVTRAPLTDADRALGYTGGLITAFDATAMNGVSVNVDTLDARLDWNVPVLKGDLHLYGSATWQMRNVQRGLFQPKVERVNFREGPLKWRANGGLDWTRGPLMIGANLQYFGHYRIFNTLEEGVGDLLELIQGSKWVSAQAYLDLYASRRIELGGPGGKRFVNIDLGINNVLDTSPPREATFLVGDPGYSRFGDPRRRRFELALTAGF